MGYGYIAARHAEEIDGFYQRHLNRYLNFYRPSGQRERRVDAKGKERFVYKRYRTPWEVVRELEKALPEGETYLKAGLSVAVLDRVAASQSDDDLVKRWKQPKGSCWKGSGRSGAHEMKPQWAGCQDVPPVGRVRQDKPG